MPLALPSAPFSGGTVSKLIIASGGVELPTGSAAAPSLYSLNANLSKNGIYFGSNQVNISISGGQHVSITTTAFSVFTSAILAPSGDASAPGYSFNGDTNSGLYRGGVDAIGLAVGGQFKLDLTTTTVRIASGIDFQLGRIAVADAAIANTHTIQIKDLNGDTYYLLATNVAP